MAKKGSVLVVEDDPSARESMVSLLGNEYEVYVADSARRAVEVLRQVPIDTVTLEPWMPGIQGREALRQIRNESPRAKVIIVTGQRLSLWFDDMVREEVFDYFPKPFETRDLLKAVERSQVRLRLAQACS